MVMTIAIRQQVHVAEDRSVRVSSPMLEPGARVEVIVMVDTEPAMGEPYSSFDAMRAHPIDAPEDVSTRIGDRQRM